MPVCAWESFSLTVNVVSAYYLVVWMSENESCALFSFSSYLCSLCTICLTHSWFINMRASSTNKMRWGNNNEREFIKWCQTLKGLCLSLGNKPRSRKKKKKEKKGRRFPPFVIFSTVNVQGKITQQHEGRETFLSCPLVHRQYDNRSRIETRRAE